MIMELGQANVSRIALRQFLNSLAAEIEKEKL